MESHGESGTIQITRNTYDLIKDQFDCESRGTIKVKGADDMEVWHVLGRRDDPRPAVEIPRMRSDPRRSIVGEAIGALLSRSARNSLKAATRSRRRRSYSARKFR